MLTTHRVLIVFTIVLGMVLVCYVGLKLRQTQETFATFSLNRRLNFIHHQLNDSFPNDTATAAPVTVANDKAVSTLPPQPEPLIVHYVLLAGNPRETNPIELSFLDCMSVLSVMKHLQPDFIYLHTNVAEWWPFDPCNALITNWTIVQVLPVKRRFVMSGKRILRIEHEADILKLEILRDYGGLALDFDMYVLNGTEMRAVLGNNDCVTCRELTEPNLNAGFLGCKRGAAYPKMLLEKSYKKDFRPDIWIWNSGTLPFKLHALHPEMAYLVSDICTPDPDNLKGFLNGAEKQRNAWRNKMAKHSFSHDREYGLKDLKSAKTGFGDMLQWILQGNGTLF